MPNFAREVRRLKVRYTFVQAGIHDVAGKRAARIIKGFLRENSHNFLFKVLIKRYSSRIESIQCKFKQYRRNTGHRFAILLDAYRTVWQSMLCIKNPKKKDKELQDKLRNIKEESRDAVLKRYNNYCKDQHAFVFLAYRRKLHQLSCSKSQKLAYNLRVGIRRTHHYSLINPLTDTLELDPEKLGPKLETLISCLDPDVKAIQRKDPLFGLERYFESEEMKQFGFFEDCDANMLAEQFPAFYSFYPTEATMQKLIRRMTQIKSPQDIDLLWPGYRRGMVSDEEGHETTTELVPLVYVPNHILYYYEL